MLNKSNQTKKIKVAYTTIYERSLRWQCSLLYLNIIYLIAYLNLTQQKCLKEKSYQTGKN